MKQHDTGVFELEPGERDAIRVLFPRFIAGMLERLRKQGIARRVLVRAAEETLQELFGPQARVRDDEREKNPDGNAKQPDGNSDPAR